MLTGRNYPASLGLDPAATCGSSQTTSRTRMRSANGDVRRSRRLAVERKSARRPARTPHSNGPAVREPITFPLADDEPVVTVIADGDVADEEAAVAARLDLEPRSRRDAEVCRAFILPYEASYPRS